jgi:thiol-disulfide isomerase/thioredoxin
MLISLNLQKLPTAYRLYKSGQIEKSKFIELFPDVLNDTILLNGNKPIYNQLLVISGFKNGQQFIIPDLNFNKDFSDDKILEYSIEIKDIFTTRLNNKSEFPIIDFEYQTVENGKIFNLQRQVLLYPRTNHKHAYLEKSGILDDSTNQYTIMLEVLDYANGNLSYEGSKYSISIQGKSHEDVQVIIKPESFIYEKENDFLQQFITYRIGDTFNLGTSPFKIKNLSGDFKKLTLQKTVSEGTEISIAAIRNSFRNESVKDFNGNSFKIFTSEENDTYSLVEFWGSWCGPCKELTPKIKEFNTKYSDIVKITSIAYEDNVEDAMEYVDNNDLNWRHGVVMRVRSSDNIVVSWKIKSYPTFLLFNRENRLVYAGNSGRALVKIDSIMKSIKK